MRGSVLVAVDLLWSEPEPWTKTGSLLENLCSSLRQMQNLAGSIFLSSDVDKVTTGERECRCCATGQRKRKAEGIILDEAPLIRPAKSAANL